MRHHSAFLASIVAAATATAGLIVAGGVPALAASSAAAPSAVPAAITPGTGSWGATQAIPGLTANGEIDVMDVSCAPGGACVAVGDNFATTNPANTAFMVTDTHGTWGKPAAIPGLEAALGNSADVERVSCPAAGDCLVVGDYVSGASFAMRGYVQEELAGKWGKPTPIPGLAALDTAGETFITGATCTAPGYCTVTGSYGTGSPSAASTTENGFVVDEVAHKWGTAIPIPGLAALNVGGMAMADSLACPSPKNCTIEGVYLPAASSAAARSAARSDLRAMAGPGLAGRPGGAATTALAALRHQSLASSPSSSMAVFVDSEVNGTWQQASAPAIPGLTSTDLVLPSSNVACASAGNCVAFGLYLDPSSSTTASPGSYQLTQSAGGWSVTASKTATAAIFAVSCPGLGSCVAGGEDVKGVAVTMRQAGGTWTTPAELPGATGLNFSGKKAQYSEIDSLACKSAGNCTAGGTYAWGVTTANPSGSDSVFVAGEASGTWSAARVPAGLVALNSGGGASVTGLSCAAVATCAVVGDYTTRNAQGGFLLAEIPVQATGSLIGLSAARVSYGAEQAERVSVKVTAHVLVTGRVTVKAGTRTICVITLASGKGSCVLTARQLPVGTYHLVASYPGGYGLAASSSAAVTLTVAK